MGRSRRMHEPKATLRPISGQWAAFMTSDIGLRPGPAKGSLGRLGGQSGKLQLAASQAVNVQ